MFDNSVIRFLFQSYCRSWIVGLYFRDYHFFFFKLHSKKLPQSMKFDNSVIRFLFRVIADHGLSTFDFRKKIWEDNSEIIKFSLALGMTFRGKCSFLGIYILWSLHTSMFLVCLQNMYQGQSLVLRIGNIQVYRKNHDCWFWRRFYCCVDQASTLREKKLLKS